MISFSTLLTLSSTKFSSCGLQFALKQSKMSKKQTLFQSFMVFMQICRLYIQCGYQWRQNQRNSPMRISRYDCVIPWKIWFSLILALLYGVFCTKLLRSRTVIVYGFKKLFYKLTTTCFINFCLFYCCILNRVLFTTSVLQYLLYLGIMGNVCR